MNALEAFPGLQECIVAAFGKAAWVNQGGISAHGSDDGGRICMTHDGWAALPQLLAEALSSIASEHARLTEERDAAVGLAERLGFEVEVLGTENDELEEQAEEDARKLAAAEVQLATLKAAAARNAEVIARMREAISAAEIRFVDIANSRVDVRRHAALGASELRAILTSPENADV